MKICSFENISRKYNDIFDECIDKALKSNLKTKHSACLVNNGKIIAIENNKYCVKKFSLHAEENLYKKIMKNSYLLKKYKQYDLYIIRYSYKSGFMNSKPCYHCTNLIKKMMPFVNKVIYSNDFDTFTVQNKMKLINNHISLGYKSIYRKKSI